MMHWTNVKEIADDCKSRYEAMKDVTAEYDKIQAEDYEQLHIIATNYKVRLCTKGDLIKYVGSRD